MVSKSSYGICGRKATMNVMPPRRDFVCLCLDCFSFSCSPPPPPPQTFPFHRNCLQHCRYISYYNSAPCIVHKQCGMAATTDQRLRRQPPDMHGEQRPSPRPLQDCKKGCAGCWCRCQRSRARRVVAVVEAVFPSDGRH